MRIISGKYRGKRFNPPKNFPSRPTTDFAKESLFNILNNQVEYEELRVLDLFAGTGSIGMEFLSRGAKQVISIDMHPVSIKFLKSMHDEIKDENWKVLRREVFAFLKQPSEPFDLIFADPPFGLKKLKDLPSAIRNSGFLAEDGMLIIEHGKETDLSKEPNFIETRNYGGVQFSFFNAG